jgi:hypothetical protein
MARATRTTTIRVSGPLFDGLAERAIEDWKQAVEKELANQGQDEIRRRAARMHRSKRPHTGAAERSVHVYQRGSAWAVSGESSKGEVWWPWLEGTSRRNYTTRFKGYHTFRIVRNVLQRRARKVGEDILRRYLPAMGGRP